MKKFFVGVMALVMGVFFVGCGDEKIAPGGADYRAVCAYIHEDFYDKFDAMDFKIDDLEFNNAKSISFYFYFAIQYDEDGLPTINKRTRVNRYILVELDEVGKKYADQAIKHLSTLYFIEYTDYRYSVGPGEKLVFEGGNE